MTDPGMEAVLAELMAEHVSDDEGTTGKGDPMRYCDCGGPEDTEKPPVKRGNLPAVPLKRRTDLVMVPCDTCQGPRHYGQQCGYCGTHR